MNNSHALIIDDNMKNVSVLARMLAEQGVTSTPVTNPRLLDNLLDVLPNLAAVFLDLEMPGLNGYEVLSKLKADARFKDVPVVAYTIHIDHVGVAHRHGFDGLIAKPIDADRFPNQLARVLRREPVWDVA